jgi:hypothetical protein
MHQQHHKSAPSTVYDYEGCGVTCFCVSEMVINSECEKKISRKVLLNESESNATKTEGTLSGPRLKPARTAVTYFLYLFIPLLLFSLPLWISFLISISYFYLSPEYLSR